MQDKLLVKLSSMPSYEEYIAIMILIIMIMICISKSVIYW